MSDNRLIDVLDPVAPNQATEMRLSPRPHSLRGLTVAVIDDNQPNADLIMGTIAHNFLEVAGVRKVLYRNFKTGTAFDLDGKSKLNASASTLPEVAANCDAAIVGVAH